MKRKVLLGLVFFSLCFVAGGVYIMRSINKVIADLQTVIALQKVGLQRQNLLNTIKIMQTDLLLKNSPHARSVAVIIAHGEDMDAAVQVCFGCHHPGSPMHATLTHVKNQITLYQERLSRVYTFRAPITRMNEEEGLAYAQGKHLLDTVQNLCVPSAQKIALRTTRVRNKIADTRQLLVVLVTIGPVLIILLAFYFLRRFTGSVTTLIEATRKIKNGDLSSRVPKSLQDEFNELALAFDEMAHSLHKQRSKIESAQKRYRMLFENAGDAIFILEAEGEEAGKIISANQAAAKMHGYTVDELLALNIRDLDAPAGSGKAPNRIQQMLAGEWVNITLKHRKKDETIFPVETNSGTLEIDDHRYILAIVRDITERVNTEKALQRSKQMAMVGQMAAGLAHEIKNPLAGIKVSMEVLASELNIPQEDREVFIRIVGEINRIEKLLKNLLEYARPPKPQFEPCDIHQVIDNVVRNVQFSLKSSAYSSRKQKEVTIDKALTDHVPMVLADSIQIQQVLLNLLLNAVDAIPQQGKISVTTQLKDQGVEIIVSDSGKGIEETVLKQIFEPFFTTKSKGTGLGLAISRRLIEQHGGSLEAGNNPDGGAFFTIRLPVRADN